MAADLRAVTPVKRPAPAYDWSGFYADGHLGVAWGRSDWSTPPNFSGPLDLFQSIDTFNESGSFFAGVQVG
jgi:hypothetical protein